MTTVGIEEDATGNHEPAELREGFAKRPWKATSGIRGGNIVIKRAAVQIIAKGFKDGIELFEIRYRALKSTSLEYCRRLLEFGY